MKLFNGIIGVFAIFESLYCIFWSGEMWIPVGLIVAIILGLWGICAIVEYAMEKKGNRVVSVGVNGAFGLIFGIIAIIISILSMTSFGVRIATTLLITVAFSIYLIVEGIVWIVSSNRVRKNKQVRSAAAVLFGMIFIIAGVFGIVSVINLTIYFILMIGILLLIFGIGRIASVFAYDEATERSIIW